MKTQQNKTAWWSPASRRLARLATFALAVLAAGGAWAATLSSSGYISKDSANPTAVFSGVSLSDIGTKYVLSGKMGGKWVSTKEAAGVYNASSDGTTLTVQFQKVDGDSPKYVKCVIVKFTEATVNDVNTIYAYAHATGNSTTLALGQDFSSATGTPSTGDNVDGYGMFDLSLTAGKKFEFKTTGPTTYTTSGGWGAWALWTLKLPTSEALPEDTLVKLTDVRIGSRTSTWDAEYDSAYMSVCDFNSTEIYSAQISAYVANRKLLWGSTAVNVLQYQFPDSTPVIVEAGASNAVRFLYADKTYKSNSQNPGGCYFVQSGENVPYALKTNNDAMGDWRPIQEVEVLVVATATASANANWSGLAWSNGAADWTAAGSTPVLLKVTENCTITLDSAVSLESVIFDITEGKTLTLAGSNNLTAANGIIVKGGTVAMTSSLLRGTVYGNGTLYYNGVRPTTSGTDVVLTNDVWRGTVRITYNYANSASGGDRELFPNYWGSDNSKIEMNGVCGYFGGKTSKAGWILKNLTVNDTIYAALKKNDGASSGQTKAPSLEGDGEFCDESNPTERFQFTDGSAFEGKITINRSADNGMNVQFGATAVAKVPRTIHVLSGASVTIASGKTWQAGGGVVVNGNLVFDGTGLVSGPVTTASGSTLDFSEATSNARISGTLTLASGTTIKLPAGATLPYQLATAGNGGLIDNVTVQIGDGTPVTGTVALSGGTISVLAPVNIDTDKTYTVSDVFGTPSAASSYEINVTSDATLTVPETAVGTILYNFTAVNNTITLSGGYKIPAAAQYLKITDASTLTAGNYTLFQWTTPQQFTTACAGYGRFAFVDTTGLDSSLTAEVIYGAKAIYLRVYNTATQSARKPLVIWPYGDSITEGFNQQHTGTNYRILLYQKLRMLGYNVKSTGVYDLDDGSNSVDPSGTPLTDTDKWHSAKHGAPVSAGISGLAGRAALVENVDTLCVQAGTPDVVLLHIGVNDLSQTSDVDSVFEAWTNVVGRLVRNLPNSQIVVSTALYGRDDQVERNRRVTSYNDKIKALIADMPDEWDGHVVLADLCSLVDSNTTGILYSQDTVHPDWWGYDQMAEGWLAKILELYNDPDATNFPSQAALPAIPGSSELGAANKSELDDYRAGFTKYGDVRVAHGQDINNIVYDNFDENAVASNIGRVGYFVEYVRTDNHAHKWVWVDMDAFGNRDIASIGLPAVTQQDVVNHLHVYSNHGAIDNVAADDDTVKGFVEFTPYNIGAAASNIPGAPADSCPTSNQLDWNDTPSSTGEGTYSSMQVFRIAPPSGRPAQTIFGFNNWRSFDTNPAEFGIGNFAQHFWSGSVQTLDYVHTRTSVKMNADAYTVKTIEIWTKPVYTATMSATGNFSGLEFSPALPGDISACDLIVNVTDDATLTFDAAKSVGAITFNIDANKTLTLDGVSNLTVGKVILSGSGKLAFTASPSFGAMLVAGNATIVLGSGQSITLTGALTIDSGVTLTMKPASIDSHSAAMISAGSVVNNGTVALTAPDSGSDYSVSISGTAVTLRRVTTESFKYNPVPGDNTPTGWVASWGGNAFATTSLRVGPTSAIPYVYHVSDNAHPYYDLSPRNDTSNHKVSCAVYANVSQMASSGKQVIASFGNTVYSLIMYREGDAVKVGRVRNSSFVSGTDGDASITIPNDNGYHLWTFTCEFKSGNDTSDKTIALYLDDGVGVGKSSSNTAIAHDAVNLNGGFSIGSVYDGVPTGFSVGVGLAVCAVRGYDVVLQPVEIEALSDSFPATNGDVTWNVTPDNAANTVIVTSTTFGDSNYIGQSKGTLTIPAGSTVNVKHIRVLNNNATGDSATVNIAGTLNITSESTNPNVWADGTSKGVLFGHWHGQATYNITGSLLAENTYIELAYTAEDQLLDIAGGMVKTKALFAQYGNGTHTVKLRNGGTLEVAEILSTGHALTKEFKYGTFRVKADATETRAINFQGTASQPTTLDPYGHTLTLTDAALTGSGSITVFDSSTGRNGTVVFPAGSNFTGHILINDTNYENVDLSAYTGVVDYSGTASGISALNGFRGTVNFTTSVDASSINLSGATVNVSGTGVTVIFTAGQEGTLNVGSGATAKLMVTQSVSDYDGHVPMVSGTGSIQYWLSDGAQTQIEATDRINGKNLLPYYYVWDPSRSTSGSMTLSNTDLWRGGAVPDNNKNIAIYVPEGTEATFTVDADKTYGEVQTYGPGAKLTIDGTSTLTASRLSVGVATEMTSALVVTGKILNDAGLTLIGNHSCAAEIIGAGAVAVGDGTTSGTVTFTQVNSLMTGGLTVRNKAVAQTTATGGDAGSGFGPQDSAITVYTGGQLNLGNTANVCHAITINEGEANSETPVLTSSTAADDNAKQIKSLTVNANAIIDVPEGKEYGLIAASYATVPVAIKKGVTLTKTGAGKFLMASAQISNLANGEVTDAPKIVVAEGTLEIASGYNSGASACTLAEGATLDVEVQDGATLSVKKLLTVTNLEVKDGGTVSVQATLTASSLDVEGGDAAVDVNSSGALTLTSVSGAGTVRWTGKQPDANGELWKTSSSWTGTNVVMSSGTTAITDLRPDLWGREGSYVVMKNLTGYLGNNDNTTVSAKVILENGDKGYAYNVSNGYRVKWYFREIAGSGDILDTHQIGSTYTGGAQQFIFKAATDFTGSVRIDDSGSGQHHTKRYTFSSTSYDTAPETASNVGVIKVLSDGSAVIGNNKIWKVDNGITIAGTVSLQGSATMASAVTASGSAKIILADSPLTMSSSLTASALVIDPGSITLNRMTPVALITGLASEPSNDTVAAIVVDGAEVTKVQDSGTSKWSICARLRNNDPWTCGDGNWTSTSFGGVNDYSDHDYMSLTFSDSAANPSTPVTVTLDGTRTPKKTVTFNATTTAYTLTGGTFAPSGTVTLADNVSVTIESAATGTYEVGSGATLTLKNATVTSVSGAGTLNIPAGGVVTLATADALDDLTYLVGEGTLALGANVPTSKLAALLEKSYTEDETVKYYWNGTLEIDGYSRTSGSGTDVSSYGNKDSVVRLKDCTFFYFTDFNYTGTVEVKGTVTVLNGSSGVATTIAKLKGDGTFAATGNCRQIYRFTDATQFSGSFNINYAADSGNSHTYSGRRIVIGTSQSGNANGANEKNTTPAIYVDANYSATLGNNATWTAIKGIFVNGSLEVVGRGTFASNVTFGNGATLTFDSLNTTTAALAAEGTVTVASGSTVNVAIDAGVSLDDGLKLISWAAAPDGKFRLVNNSSIDYALEKQSNGLYLVTPVAEYNGVKYPSVQEAIDDAGNANVGSIMVRNAGATIPEGYALVTAANGTMTVRRPGTVYYKTGYWGTPSDSNVFTVEMSDGSATTLLEGDTVVVDSTHCSASSAWAAPALPKTVAGVTINKDFTFYPGSDQSATLSGVAFTIDTDKTLTFQANSRDMILGPMSLSGGTVVLDNNSRSLTISGALTGTSTLSVGTGKTITVGSAGSIASTLPLTGNGTVVLEALSGLGAAPGEGWTGTVQLPNITETREGGYSLNNYGNANSIVRITGFSGEAWLHNEAVNPTVELAGDMILNSFSEGHANTISNLTGVGTFSVANTNLTQANYYLVKDASEHTGSLSVATPCLALGTNSKPEVSETDRTTLGRIRVFGDAKIGDGKFWAATNAIVLESSCCVELLGAATMYGGINMANGATLKFDDIGTSAAPKMLALTPGDGQSVFVSHDVTVVVELGVGVDITAEGVNTKLISWPDAVAGSFVWGESADARFGEAYRLDVQSDGLYIVPRIVTPLTDADDATVGVGYCLDGTEVVITNTATASGGAATIVLPDGATQAEVYPTSSQFYLKGSQGIIMSLLYMGSDKLTMYAKYIVDGVEHVQDITSAYPSSGGSGQWTSYYREDGENIIVTYSLLPGNSVSVDGVDIPVTPTLATVGESAPMAVADGEPTFAIKTIPGLWYSVWSATAMNGDALASGSLSKPETPIQATSSTTTIDNGAAASSGVRYYKIAVGTSAADVK